MLRRLSAGEYTLVYSEPLLAELLAKLVLPRIKHKYHLTDETVERTMALIALRGMRVQPTRVVRVCRDPKDNMLIEAALAGEAGYLVSGDDDLLVLKSFETVRIVNSQDFLKAF